MVLNPNLFEFFGYLYMFLGYFCAYLPFIYHSVFNSEYIVIVLRSEEVITFVLNESDQRKQNPCMSFNFLDHEKAF
jgi:hypothetical protein